LSRSFVFVHLATPGLEVAAWSLALLQKLSERTWRTRMTSAAHAWFR